MLYLILDKLTSFFRFPSSKQVKTSPCAWIELLKRKSSMTIEQFTEVLEKLLEDLLMINSQQLNTP
jgi:hypothetical protein